MTVAGCKIKFGGDGGGSNPINWDVTTEKTVMELCGQRFSEHAKTKQKG